MATTRDIRRPNQYAGGPMLGSVFIGMGMGPMNGSDHTENGPLYRNTQTPAWSRCTCFDTPEGYDQGPWAEGMIPSPLGRGLPSRWGYGKSF
jgi:hypothetical protein